jgi:hypothetical protein
MDTTPGLKVLSNLAIARSGTQRIGNKLQELKRFQEEIWTQDVRMNSQSCPLLGAEAHRHNRAVGSVHIASVY